MSLPTPNTRKEQYLNAIATGNAGGLPTPITREEEYLEAIAKSGGSGEGDMKKSVYDSDLAVSNAGGINGFVNSAVAGKVDKVEGKGLSTNDYDNTEKEQNEANAEAIEAIVNKYGSKNLAPFPNLYTKVEEGVTWTVIREQGSNNGKVTAVGTASTWSIVSTKNFFLHAGSYVISAGANDIYHCYVQLGNISDSSLVATTYGKFSVSFELTHDAELRLDYVIYEGATVNDVFACMIRDARITDPTYEPYAMTNKELTERLKATTQVVSSAMISPLSSSNSLCPATPPDTGYKLVGFVFDSGGTYGTFLNWFYEESNNRFSATNTHATETAEAYGTMRMLWMKI